MLVKKKETTKEVKRPKCYVVGGGFDYIRLMYSLGCDGARHIDEADLVLFTGGEDVNPELYDEIPMAKTHYNRARDEAESRIFEQALDRDLPMVGICRGGQFLNVKCGGKMWQHVTGHTGTHLMFVEVPPFNKEGKRRVLSVTSTHHQMMIPTDDAIILGTADCSLEKNGPAISRIGKDPENPDVEVVWYQDEKCLCFQPHPEFASAPAECVDFFEECMDNFIYPSIPQKIMMITDQTKEK